MAMVQLGRPSLVALYVRGFHLFCNRTLTSLQPGKDRLYSIPLVSSNEKLPFRIGIGAVQAVRSQNFCVQATTEASDSGQVNFSLIQSMEKKIKDNLNAESVTVRDAYGDGRHVSIDVISTAFEGQSAVNRQRMVYKSILEELQNTVHAVDQMTTRTPAEAGVGK